MAFVNEYISDEDFAKYGLRAIDAGISPLGLNAHVNSKDWTIDRERNIYLRQFSAGRELDDSHLTGWTFYWRGELLWFLREGIESRRERVGQKWSHFKISKLKIPSHLKQHQEEILNDIREAFLTYAGGGVFNKTTEYSQQIDFDLE